MKRAFLFPGQGAQHVGMGRFLHDHSPKARALLEAADRALGGRLVKTMFEGPESRLQETEITQPALFATSLAACQVLEDAGIHPDAVAGHSIGEYSALTAAGVWEWEEGLELVKKRGAIMQEIAQSRPGGMAAILGLPVSQVQAICRQAHDKGVCEVVNYNSPEQVVIAGEPDALSEAIRLANQEGAKRTIALKVSGAFHSSLMREAAHRMAGALRTVPFRPPRCPIAMNADGDLHLDPEEIRQQLIRQMDHPVLWEEAIRHLRRSGIGLFIEVGVGCVLTGLLKRIDREATALTTDSWEALEQTMKEVCL